MDEIQDPVVTEMGEKHPNFFRILSSMGVNDRERSMRKWQTTKTVIKRVIFTYRAVPLLPGRQQKMH